MFEGVSCLAGKGVAHLLTGRLFYFTCCLRPTPENCKRSSSAWINLAMVAWQFRWGTVSDPRAPQTAQRSWKEMGMISATCRDLSPPLSGDLADTGHVPAPKRGANQLSSYSCV